MQRIVVVLPAPLRPEEADEPAGPDGEARAVEGDDGAVGLGEVVDLEHGGQALRAIVASHRRIGLDR